MKMSLLTFVFGSVLLFCILELVEGSKVCYDAKTCIHNASEKCGEEKGKYRRFFDSCDMLEYNCLKNTDYTKTDPSNCKSLPPIQEENKADTVQP